MWHKAVLPLLITFLVVPNLSAQTAVGILARSGLIPSAVTVYEAGNKVFVGDDSTGDLVMFDGTTLEVLNSVNVGGPVWNMAVDEAHGKLYATVNTLGYYGGQVVEVNAATGEFIRQFDLGPNGILAYPFAYDPNLAKVYVIDSAFSPQHLVQIDVATDTTASVALPDANYTLAALAVNPVTHEAFVGITGHGLPLQIINGVTLEKTTGPEDTFNGSFWGLAVNWIENRLYRAPYMGGPFTIYDRDTGSVTNVGSNDAGLVFFNPAGNKIYSDVEIDGYATVIDGATDAAQNLGLYGLAIGARLSTNHVYYDGGNNSHYLVDDSTQMVEAIPYSEAPPDCTLPSGGSYSGLVVNQTTGRVFIIAGCYVQVLQDEKELSRPPVYVAAVLTGLDSFTLNVLDPASKATVSSSLGYAVYGLAVRPGGGRVYEATYDKFSLNGSIRIYAGIGDHALQTSFDDGGHDPTVPVVTPDSSRLYVTNATSADVSVVNLADNSVETTIPVGTTGSKPWGAAVTPDGAKLYVANRGNGTVHVISTASNTVSSTIPVGTAPWGVAVNPSGTKAYVANSGSNSVSVIDTATDAVIGTVYVGTTPHWLVVSPDGGRVYVTNSGGGTVSVVETATDTVIQTVTVGTTPEGVAVMPDGSEVYVVNFNSSAASSLSVINPSDYSVTPVSLPTESRGAIPIAIADPTSKFAGRVTNLHGAVEGAVVRALQSAVEKGTATTNAAGDYSIFNLLPGTYDIEVTGPGCTPLTMNSRSVGIGRTTVLSPALTQGECPSPEVQLSPRSLAFGAQQLSVASDAQPVSLTNTGAVDLYITSIAKSGGNTGDFSISHNCPISPIKVSDTGFCTVNVTFAPTAPGPRKTALLVSSDAPGSPHRIILTGQGSAVSLSPTDWNFGSLPAQASSAPKVITLTNLGGTPIHVWSSSVSGVHAEDFSRTGNCPAPPATLAGGNSCTFSVTFTPKAAGAHTAPFAISHDGGASPASVSLTGTGTSVLQVQSANSPTVIVPVVLPEAMTPADNPLPSADGKRKAKASKKRNGRQKALPAGQTDFVPRP